MICELSRINLKALKEKASKAIYNFLERNQPLLSLHGHIHESPDPSRSWYAKLGSTLCIQPGQLTPFTSAVALEESCRNLRTPF
jgi:Icc-related predicted phosphoesterase